MNDVDIDNGLHSRFWADIYYAPGHTTLLPTLPVRPFLPPPSLPPFIPFAHRFRASGPCPMCTSLGMSVATIRLLIACALARAWIALVGWALRRLSDEPPRASWGILGGA
eukprot:scaffold166489_cov33-Tisochrysis_lutea.AAC.4